MINIVNIKFAFDSRYIKSILI
jgi:hypothetical protein